MKIIDLLNRIAKGEEVPKTIKYNGIYYTYDKEQDDYSAFVVSRYEYLLDDINTFEQLTNEIEIIEEVEDKEYEDIDYADNLEQGEYIDYANDYEVKFDIVKNRRLINTLIRNQKKIIKHLENK